MKIAIIGTGGVGGYFGAKMAKAGYDVTFVARGEHLKAMQTNGLTVKSILGDFTLQNVKATAQITNLTGMDLILICVKAWQVQDVARELKSVIQGTTTVMPLQNGVSAIGELEEQLPGTHIIGGLCRIFSKIDAPGVINHFGIEPTIEFGEINGIASERITRIKELLDRSGIKAIVSEDIVAGIWKKFIINCASGLLAITRTTYGELREIKETRQMIAGLYAEIYEVSQKAGIRIEPGFVEKTMALLDTYPYNATSSLTRDIWAGKPSEIDYQNGMVVTLGQKYGVDTPINQMIYHCIIPMEQKARGRI